MLYLTQPPLFIILIIFNRLSASPDAEVQELYVPHSPGLDSTSITPVTSGSQFPITPTTSGTSYDGFGANDGGTSSGIRKEIDPTTLFVGGLEASGPGAWDEAKVRQLFARFGGLESVKFVRPGRTLYPLGRVPLSYTICRECHDRLRICQIQQCGISCSCRL